MREILFRGKRVDNGEWIEGFFAKIGDKTFILIDTGIAFGYVTMKEVLSETIGQYTGLTDKNGKKIFEGDILQGYQYPYLSEGHFNYYAEVIYFEICPAFGLYTFKNPNLDIVKGISSGTTDFMEDWESENWEIIGNIYDNPEMLED